MSRWMMTRPGAIVGQAGLEVTIPVLPRVGFHNLASGLDLVFYAARSYSLMRPPRRAGAGAAGGLGAVVVVPGVVGED